MNTRTTNFLMDGNRTLIAGNRFLRDVFTVLSKKDLIRMATVPDKELLITPRLLAKWIWALLSDEDRQDFPHFSDVLHYIEQRPFTNTLFDFVMAVSRLGPADEPVLQEVFATPYDFN